MEAYGPYNLCWQYHADIFISITKHGQGGESFISKIDNKNAKGSLIWRNPDTREGLVNISVQNSDTNENSSMALISRIIATDVGFPY